MIKELLNKIKKLFSEHPASVGETYFTHFKCAASFGLILLGAGIAGLIHCVFPFLCVTTAGDLVEKLHLKMTARRNKSYSNK